MLADQIVKAEGSASEKVLLLLRTLFLLSVMRNCVDQQWPTKVTIH